MGVWDDLDESEISRPEIMSQSTPATSTLIFVHLLHKVYLKNILKLYLSILNKINLKYTTFW